MRAVCVPEFKMVHGEVAFVLGGGTDKVSLLIISYCLNMSVSVWQQMEHTRFECMLLLSQAGTDFLLCCSF